MTFELDNTWLYSIIAVLFFFYNDQFIWVTIVFGERISGKPIIHTHRIFRYATYFSVAQHAAAVVYTTCSYQRNYCPFPQLVVVRNLRPRRLGWICFVPVERSIEITIPDYISQTDDCNKICFNQRATKTINQQTL